MKILFIDPFSGISGDMFLGAMVDAGLPMHVLQKAFDGLHLPEHFHIYAEKVLKGALSATLFHIDLHDHAEHSHDHSHHDKKQEHEHSKDAHALGHRSMADIRTLIKSSHLNNAVKARTLLIFEKLAEAEGQVHGVPADKVHFHEVGATDSILDIVGAAVGLEYFDIEQVYCAALPWSSGRVMTQHGEMPLPAPATQALLTMAGAPVRPLECGMELVTPTGAAIVAAFARFEQPTMRLIASGSGAGRRELPWANIMRLIIGEADQVRQTTHTILETHIDDMNPELYGALMERLFAAGALDVAYTPIFMKKNRPATCVTVVVQAADEDRLANLILTESTTFGVRAYPVQRYEAERDFIVVNISLGDVRVKRKWLDGKVIQSVPEYEECRRLADEHCLPVQAVFQMVMEKL
jgi:uncharacterized protein (TIGR00299 family) protein